VRSLALILLPLVLLCSCGQLAPVGAHEGMRAPGFKAPLVGGDSVSLGELEGKPVVLVFWASWCGPCRYEVPHVSALHRELGDTAHLLGVNAGEDAGTVQAAIQALGIDYPVVLDPSGSISRSYEATALPMFIVLGPEGRVRLRGNSLPERINSLVAGLRRAGP